MEMNEYQRIVAGRKEPDRCGSSSKCSKLLQMKP